MNSHRLCYISSSCKHCWNEHRYSSTWKAIGRFVGT